jgi:hypothetical protein
MFRVWEIHKLKSFIGQRIIGLEMNHCICTPCNKGEHDNCVNQFCNCNKITTTKIIKCEDSLK